MSSAHRSWSERRFDRMAATVRTPADLEASRLEGRRQQAEVIAEALAAGILTADQAAALRARYGLLAEDANGG